MLGIRKAAEADRRKSPRRILGRPGSIIVGQVKLECIIHDFSDGGAKIELIDDVVIASSFYLYLPSEGLIGTVNLVWRSRKVVGVKVIDRWITPAEMPDHSLRLVIG